MCEGKDLPRIADAPGIQLSECGEHTSSLTPLEAIGGHEGLGGEYWGNEHHNRCELFLAEKGQGYIRIHNVQFRQNTRLRSPYQSLAADKSVRLPVPAAYFDDMT